MMIRIRLVPVIYLMDGHIVRSEGFSDFRAIGNPVSELARYSGWLADEVVYIDISREDGPGGAGWRRDHRIGGIASRPALLGAIAEHATMPLAFGGRVRGIEEADTIIRTGADKVVLNSAAHRTPGLVSRLAAKYGSQAVTVGIDARRVDRDYQVWIDQGRERLPLSPEACARQAEASGAGEILLTSIDRDGSGNGYDLELVRRVVAAVSVPVIACGGAGSPGDLVAGAREGGAHALAAGNLFHFTEHAYKRSKRHLLAEGIHIRFPWPA